MGINTGFIPLMLNDATHPGSLARKIWEDKYRWHNGDDVLERDITDSWRRVAWALAQNESDSELWSERFYGILDGFQFLPAGRILAGSGTGTKLTLFNCFVMGQISDTIDGIFSALREGALTMQKGGGIGYDFSSLRPRGTRADGSATVASGPVSFMSVWDAMCGTLLSTGSRRGAMMATLRCDHPDILEFIHAKHSAEKLTHFNLSVLVSDAFMAAVEKDDSWDLVFPPQGGKVYKEMSARKLWQTIVQSAYDSAEPGIIFIDRINQLNNLAYCETITATNPCGELPLPPYGACDLGSINLTRFVRAAFTQTADLDWNRLRNVIHVAVRMMDDVIDVSSYPLAQQRENQLARRRIGLGITGLADALIMLGLRYDSADARHLAEKIMAMVCHESYRVSISLAREKGVFPLFDKDRYLRAGFIQTLPADIRAGIETFGVRNSHLTAIAPTGTISLLAGNVSSGLEPVFASRYQRRILSAAGQSQDFEVMDYACALWQSMHNTESLPETYVAAADIDPMAHLAMQTALQKHVDSAISKTINLPQDSPPELLDKVFRQAYLDGLKGCTAYRQGSLRGGVLVAPTSPPESHCCNPDREID